MDSNWFQVVQVTFYVFYICRYVTTVIARIYYDINATWSSKLYADEIRRSNLMQTIRLLEVEDDINKVSLWSWPAANYIKDLFSNVPIANRTSTAYAKSVGCLRLSRTKLRSKPPSSHNEQREYLKRIWLITSCRYNCSAFFAGHVRRSRVIAGSAGVLATGLWPADSI